MKLSLELLDDIEKNRNDMLNLEQAVKKLNKPFFIIHGDKDTSVYFEEGKALFGYANRELSSFLRIPQINHTFNVVHPFSKSNSMFVLVLKNTNSFFNKNLNKV